MLLFFAFLGIDVSLAASQNADLSVEIINPKSFPGMPFAQLSQKQVDDYLNFPNELRFLIPVPFDPFHRAEKLGIQGLPQRIERNSLGTTEKPRSFAGTLSKTQKANASYLFGGFSAVQPADATGVASFGF